MSKDLLTEFSKQFPLIRLFYHNEKYFAFDSRSNLLTEITMDDIENMIKFNNCDDYTEKDLGEYRNLFSRGVFLPKGTDKIAPNKHEINKNIESDFNDVIPRKFILEVTQSCTLRCKYCYFSESNDNRTHNETEMSKEIAKNAIDLYFKVYTDSIKELSIEKRKKIIKIAVPNLSWWGGEPFLNFDLMKWSKQYFEAKPWSEFDICPEDLVYSIVTNFTIVNEEILSFLSNNNVYTFISIDGNKEHHDSNRIFANGKGSFNTVKKNIDKLINKYPEYCKKHVCLQAVKAENIDHNTAYKYIKETYDGKIIKCMSYQQSYWGKERKSELTTVFNQDKEYYENLYNSLNDLSEKEFRELFDNNNDYYDFFKGLFSLERCLVFDNPRSTEFRLRSFSCPIGIDAIFVDAIGQLHMCNKTDYSYPIGDVKSGLDITRLIKLYEDYYADIYNNCRECWAFGLCKICPATTMIEGKFKVKDSDICKFTQMDIHSRLYGYIILNSFENVYDNAKEYCRRRSEEYSFLTFEGAVYKSDINY